MFISFIIPLYNHIEKTKQMFSSLEASLPKNLKYEIIFVDDFSSDETQKWLKSLENKKVKYFLNEENKGYAISNNIGVKNSIGDILCLLNNDLLFEPGWLEPMIDILIDSKLNTGIVGNIQYRISDKKIDHAGIYLTYNSQFHHIRKLPKSKENYEKVFAVTGACVILKKVDFQAVGGFDEIYVNGCEDVDLCIKLQKLQKNIYLCPKSKIFHHVSLSRGKTSLQNIKNSFLLFNKHKVEIKNELKKVWETLINSKEYRKYIDGDLDLSKGNFVQLLAQNMFQKEEDNLKKQLNIRNNDILQNIQIKNWNYDLFSGVFFLENNSQVILENISSLESFYICGYYEKGFKNNKLMVKINLNNLQEKSFLLEKGKNFNLGIKTPILLENEKNIITIEFSKDIKMTFSHFVINGEKIDSIKLYKDDFHNNFSFLNSLIRTLRPDLCKLFPIETSKEKLKWIYWLINTGVNEYKSILENKGFKNLLSTRQQSTSLTLIQQLILDKRKDLQKVFLEKGNLKGYLQWFFTHGVEEHKYYMWLNDIQKDIVLSQPEPWPSRLKDIINQEKITNTTKDTSDFGVNIIGYVYGQLGIGEDVRMAARAMLKSKIPFIMIDFPPGSDISQNDKSMKKYVSKEFKYKFNIFCMTALENGRFYAEKGYSSMKNMYNIGYWPWELSRWPKEWESLVHLVDEIWVSSKHTYDSIIKVSTVPVYIMPMAVELGGISAKKRKDFKLPKKTKLFCFSFDLNSSIYRKNPEACLDSFLKAFPKDSKEDVGLVVKVHPPKNKNKNWEKLKKIAGKDKRIYIIEETLSREDLLALYSCCDCFLSLHRAEGFGRGIAEAIQLGLHVITTGYSGNVDFSKGKNVDLVDYKLIKVKKGEYPFGKNQVWADVDCNHAAKLMNDFVKKYKRNDDLVQIKEFSTKFVGDNYKKRLEEIYSNIN